MGKKWYMSKTIWFNVLAFVVAVASPILTGAGYTGEVPASWQVYIPAVVALINTLLRAVTKEPITK